MKSINNEGETIVAADSNLIPFPFLSDHAYRSRIFQTIGADDNAVGPAINLGTWNLQDKCFYASPVMGMEPNTYKKSTPRKGQILYTTLTKATNYKYSSASGAIKEVSVDNTTLGLSAPEAILVQVKKDEPGFQEIWVTNSPFNSNESVLNYTGRKEKQIEQIIQAINAGEDIINLQEIDFLRVYGNGTILNQAKEDLQKQFYEALKKKEYGCAISAGQYNGTPQQPLAVIYNANKFKLKESKGVLHYTEEKGPNRLRGFETTFELIAQSGPINTIVNTNLHLQYGHDYKDEIEAYQKQFEKKTSIMHIMAGDCNNYQNQNLCTALGSWDECTNIGKAQDGNFTVYHEGSKDIKAYDVFFVVAPQGYKVSTAVNLKRSEQFIEAAPGQIQLVSSQDSHRSCTRVGERWRRGVHILQEKAIELLRKDPSLTDDQLLHHEAIEQIRADKDIRSNQKTITVIAEARKSIHSSGAQKNPQMLTLVSQPSMISSAPHSTMWPQPVPSLTFAAAWQKIDVQPLITYRGKRETRGGGVTVFGGFTKSEKIDGVDKLIRAIDHYNQQGNLDGFMEFPTEREAGALKDGDLYHNAVQNIIASHPLIGAWIDSFQRLTQTYRN